MTIQWPNQNAHMLFSFGVLVGKALFLPVLFSTWWVLGFLAAWAVLKEFVWDVHVEKSQGNAGAAVDMGFYLLGLVVTLVVLALTGHF